MLRYFLYLNNHLATRSPSVIVRDMRKIKFANNEFYHVYNRGVDKRKTFLDNYDFDRFLQSTQEFNSIKPIGSIYENSFRERKSQLGDRVPKLVNIICYCLNSNHFHIVLQQVADGGISEFMKRIGSGYTTYFNLKYARSGVLFQGPFKARYIDSNEYLLHVSAYVNLNNRAHKLKLGGLTSKSSWEVYMGTAENTICKKDVILNQFKNKEEYKDFAESSLVDMLERKQRSREVSDLLLE